MNKTSLIAGVLGLSLVLFLEGCGGDETPPDTPSPKGDETAKKADPASTPKTEPEPEPEPEIPPMGGLLDSNDIISINVDEDALKLIGLPASNANLANGIIAVNIFSLAT